MKNLTTTLNTGDLRPRERVLLLVRNDITKDKTGKEILSAADKHALSEGWRPENNGQVDEYNRYIEGWRMAGFAELDAQTTFLNAQMAHFRKQPLALNLLLYPHHREMRASLKRIIKIKRVDIREAVEIAGKQRATKLQNGLDFDYAVYKMAFESLSDEDKKRFNELYPDIETDHQYLDQEEVIANLLAGKNELTAKAKEKLAELVAGNCYNKFAEEYQLFHYFACIPLAEVARQFLIGKNITINGKALSQNQEADDEDDITCHAIQKAVESYAKDNNISIESILKEACLKWIHEDLFERYTPLALSSDSTLLERWLMAKANTRMVLKKHIDKGELKVRDRTSDASRQDKLYSKCLYDGELEKAQRALEAIGKKVNHDAKGELDEKVAFATFNDKIITGESLYGFKGDYLFVKDFKERVDRYDPNLGIVYADNDSERQGEHLDQELLIADTDKNGELSIVSMFGMSTKRLSAFLEGGIYFEEIERDGETILAFNNKNLEQVFIETKDDLINGYATLLSFNELFKKLSKAYEIDLAYKIKGWLDTLEDQIDEHNSMLSRATEQMPDKDKKLFIHTKPALKIDSSLYIDKDNIEPDKKRTGIYFEELNRIFGSEF